MVMFGKSASGSTRTFAGNCLRGIATARPIPNPLATYVSIKSVELASMPGNQSTPRLASCCKKTREGDSDGGRQISDSLILSSFHNSPAVL